MSISEIKIGEFFKYTFATKYKPFIIGVTLELPNAHEPLLIYRILYKSFGEIPPYSNWNCRLSSVIKHESKYGTGNVGRIWLTTCEIWNETITILSEDEAMAWLI